MSNKIEEGYCSTCFNNTKHKMVQQNYLRRNVYKCMSCETSTLMCRYCNNFANSDEKWDDELCAEHSGKIANFKMLNHKLEKLEDYKILFNRKGVNVKKVGTIGGMALVTPLTFIAAPAIGIGLTGVVAIGGLAVTSGTAILAAKGIELGSTLSAVISNSCFDAINGFEIKKIKDGEGAEIIFIDGFLTQNDKDTKDWEKELKNLYPNNPWYYISWESQKLHDLGKDYMLMGHIGALKAWGLACIKAEQTGFLLADILARTDKEYILCGHSLGARVIYYTLEALATKKKKKYINTAHLLGGAVGSKEKDWKIAKTAVKNNINNYKSDNDQVLASIYKVGTLFKSDPIGRNNIDVDGIINIDTSYIVKGHTKYKENFSSFANV